MAILTGNNGVVKIDNAAGTPTAIAAVRNFSVEQTADTIESTVMGNDVRVFKRGLSQWSGSADIYFDSADISAVAALSVAGSGSTVGGAPITVELYLDGTSNKFSGEAIITGYTVNSSMDGMVEASISIQGSGACSFTA